MFVRKDTEGVTTRYVKANREIVLEDWTRGGVEIGDKSGGSGVWGDAAVQEGLLFASLLVIEDDRCLSVKDGRTEVQRIKRTRGSKKYLRGKQKGKDQGNPHKAAPSHLTRCAPLNARQENETRNSLRKDSAARQRPAGTGNYCRMSAVATNYLRTEQSLDSWMRLVELCGNQVV